MTPDTFDPEAFRSHFPHLEELVHLASCSQGAFSREVNYALANLTRSLHLHGAPWGEWMGEVESLRAEFAAFINTTPEHLAILPSASAGAYQVASAFEWDGAKLLTSAIEFPSVGQVFQAQKPNGAEISFIGDSQAALEADIWASQMTQETKLVSVPLVSYHNGDMPDVRNIIQESQKHGAATFVDAYQGAGVVPIDVQDLDCDYLVTGTLKYLLGLAGVAFLYVKDVARAERSPEFTGWFGRENPFDFDPQDTSHPLEARRYEGGTPSVPSVYASLAGLRLIESIDQHEGFKHVMGLREYAAAELTHAGFDISQPHNTDRRGPQVAVRLADPNSAAEALAAEGVATAPRNDVLRLSLHYYTTQTDIDRAVAALQKVT